MLHPCPCNNNSWLRQRLLFLEVEKKIFGLACFSPWIKLLINKLYRIFYKFLFEKLLKTVKNCRINYFKVSRFGLYMINISKTAQPFGIVLHSDNIFQVGFLLIAFISLVILISILGYYAAKFLILKIVEKIIAHEKSPWLKSAYDRYVFHEIALLMPAFILYASAPLFAGISFGFIAMLAKPIQIITLSYLIIMLGIILCGFLNSIEEKYNQFKFARQRPIKSYLQVIKILVFVIVALVIASIWLDKSLTYFLTGLSAMTAVILLIFRNSILGFVASVQLSAHDMVRLGDWIEVTSFGADGHVIDISLNTIKVENFDKSIVMMPSYTFLSTGVKNWRAMNEAGCRRIKRVLYIDLSTIKFCDEELAQRLKTSSLVTDILDFTKYKILQTSTNLGIFRRYLEKYLSQRPDIHKNMTLLVHELEATNNGKGLPFEIYSFTKSTEWETYERTQAHIFEHIYAILILFDLKAV